VKQRILPGNRIELLQSGSAYFPALLAAIDAARAEIHLETYIFADDATGRSVALALAQAARRGVAVRVLVDGFGASDFRDRHGPALRAAGVEVLIYRPEMALLRLRRTRLRRLHRKLVVVDGRVAFVGGINVIDDMDTPGQTPPRFDYAVRIEGPLVARIHATMRHVWRLVRWARLGRRPPPPAAPLLAPVVRGTAKAALLIRDNLRHRLDIEHAYLAAIHRARREIVISCAYFLPGRRFRKTLLAAVKRGVSVKLLLQGRVEYVLQHYATQSLYDRMLSAGVRIFEYDKAFLHAKVAVIDGEWATVGSSNIDPFSLLLAREANVAVRDADFARALRASLEAAIAGSAHEVRLEDLRARSWFTRLAAAAAYSVVRILIGVSRYGGKQYSD